MEVQAPTPLPTSPVSGEGYIVQLPSYTSLGLGSQFDQAFQQCLTITLAALGILLTVKFLNSLKK